MLDQYHIFTLSIPFAVLAPYRSTLKWKENFLPPNQHGVISPIWNVQAAETIGYQ
jgi:hypothetical protein